MWRTRAEDRVEQARRQPDGDVDAPEDPRTPGCTDHDDPVILVAGVVQDLAQMLLWQGGTLDEIRPRRPAWSPQGLVRDVIPAPPTGADAPVAAAAPVLEWGPGGD